MKFIHLLLVFGTFWAWSALAQDIDTNTPSGPARIMEASDGTRFLMVGNTRVDLPDFPFLAFIVARRGDLLLVEYSQGGNACPGFFVWVHTARGEVRRTEGFGTCSDLITLTHDSETVRVRMPSFEPGKGDVVFVYDGKSPVQKQQLGLAASGMKPGGGWDFWIDRYPYEYVAAADMQNRLRALLGPKALVEVQRSLVVSNPMERDGDWVTGQGCEAHMCGVNDAALAVNLQDGRLIIALRKGREPVRIWGNLRGSIPGAILDVVSQQN